MSASTLETHHELMTSTELAERWRVSTGHLKNLRYQQRGAPYLKLGGGHVLYRYSDVLEFEATNLVTTTQTPSQH